MRGMIKGREALIPPLALNLPLPRLVPAAAIRACANQGSHSADEQGTESRTIQEALSDSTWPADPGEACQPTEAHRFGRPADSAGPPPPPLPGAHALTRCPCCSQHLDHPCSRHVAGPRLLRGRHASLQAHPLHPLSGVLTAQSA